MEKFNLIGIILVIVIIVIVGFNAMTKEPEIGYSNTVIDASAINEKGILNLDNKTEDIGGGIFTTSKSDENSILVNNSSILKLTKSLINKTGDTATSGDSADFYGTNSAILVKDDSKLNIENCEISTNSKGSNGIFVTNTDTGQAAPGGAGGTPPEAGGNPQGEGGTPPEAGGNPQGEGGTPPGNSGNATTSENTSENHNTTATIQNVKITTHKDKSRGLDATFGGIINADNVEINTNGNSCAALATDRGEGNITITDSQLKTGVDKKSGRGSPLIYSTGNITAKHTKGTAYVSQIACIEGKNSITLDDCDLRGFGEGNRKDGDNYVDLAGVFIYQSMSGDADVGTSTFSCKDSNLTVDSLSDYYDQIPMFHVTNTKANIILESSDFHFGSGILFDISGQNQWGNTGSNGGDVNLTCNKEQMKGNINVDNISSLNFTMKNTTFEGAVNSNGTANVVLDKTSTWTLTGDSNITSLNNTGKINLNGHKLLVNGKEYNG